MILYTNKHRVAFQVDDDDVEAVSQYKWHQSKNGGYISTNIKVGNRHKNLKLHQFLNGKAPAGFEWDHKNRDKFDYRRDNLRIVTHRQNMENLSMRYDNTSGVTGVFKAEKNKGWRALIIVDHLRIHLGYFKSIEEAAQARKQAELKYWGRSE